MPLDWKSEARSVYEEVRVRILRISLDLAAPLRLLRPEQRPSWQRDATGGLAVCVMAIPQVLAYAIIAGVPPVMGLYSLVVVSLVSGLWSHSVHLAYGPSNASSLMLGAVLIAPAVRGGDLGSSVALAAVVIGLTQVGVATLNLGRLAKYISRSVIVGYTTAIGCLIFLNQITNLIGTSVDKGLGLFARVAASLRTIPDCHLPSVLVAAAAFLSIVVARRVAPFLPAGFCAILGGWFYSQAMRAFLPDWKVKLVEDIQRIPSGLPGLVLPGFGFDAIYQVAGAAIALAFLACIETSTVAKSMAMRTGGRSRPDQDILGLGLGNLAGGFFGAMPGSVSFTRSEFSFRNNVATRWWNVFCAVFGLLIVLSCRRVLEMIPIPALAALVAWLSMKLVDLNNARVALTATRSDALVYLTTFFAALFLRLDTAIYLGMLASMGLFLHKAAAPKLMEFEFDAEGGFHPARESEPSAAPQIAIIHVEGQLFFGSAEFIQDEIMQLVAPGRTKVIILRLRNAQNLDATGAMVLGQLIEDLREAGIQVLISGTTPEVDRVVTRAGLDKVIGPENHFPSQDNFLEATRRALQRARQIVGTTAEVKVFYDRDKEKERAEPRPARPRDPG